MADVEGVNIRITGDSSQAVNSVNDLMQALRRLRQERNSVAADASRPIEFNVSKMQLPQNLRVQAFTQGLQDGIAQVSAAFNDLGTRLQTTFGGIFHTIRNGLFALVGTTGVVGMEFRRALAIGGGFESTMTSVQVVSSATASEIEQLTAKAREMGATLPITAQQAGQAMLIMAQRGDDFANILTNVEDIANLAIFQGTDMQTAASLLGSTMSQFSLATEEASRIVDIFNNACNQSPLNMQYLVDAMQYVGPVAGGMGVKLEEVVAGLEALHKSGLVGSMAGTGLRMVLQKLAAQTQIAGVETKNLDGSSRKLSEIFSELKEKGYSVGQATKDFGARGANAAISLMKLSGTLEDYEQGLQKVGTTSSGVQEKMKSWPNVWNTFKSASEELHIEIFDQIKKQSKEAVGGISNLIRIFSEWINKNEAAKQILDAFLNGLRFNLPSSDTFKRWLDNINLEEIIERARGFGEGLRNLGESLVNFFNTIQAPLMFLIEHLGTFGTISFWGWILGSGLRIVSIIGQMAGGFVDLFNILSRLTSLNFTTLIAFLSNPTLLAFLALGVGTGVATYYAVDMVDKIIDRYEHSAERLEDARERFRNRWKFFTVDDANNEAITKITSDFKTGFEEIPDALDYSSEHIQEVLTKRIENLKNNFTGLVISVYNDVNAEQGKKINEVSESLGQSLTAAISGSKEAYQSLQPEMKKVIDFLQQINLTPIQAGAAQKNIDEIKANVIKAYKDLNKDLGKSNEELSGELVKKFLAPSFELYIVEALGGSKAAYEKLEPEMQKVIDYLKETGVTADKATVDFQEFLASYKNIEHIKGLKFENTDIPLTKIKQTYKDISSVINEVIEEFPNKVEEINSVLGGIGGNKINIGIELQLEDAKKSLEAFIKKTSKESGISEGVISEAVFSQLKELARQGNATAQSLANGWKDSGKGFDDFVQKARDYVEYMKVSPEKFTPALEKMAKGIQKIDPLTGKVTEQFKKAYAALKEWANVTFDKVAQRIQKLKKAVEGGFLKKESLEAEYKKVSSQVKAQIVMDLEPLKNNFSNQEQYHSVLASEYISRLQEMGGDTFVEMAKKEFANSFAKTGTAIGQMIERTAGRISDIGYSQTMRVNGQEVKQGSQGFNMQSFSQALSPVVSGIQQLATQKQQSTPFVDYSNYISSIIAELKNTNVGVQNVKVAVDSLSSNFITLGEAMRNSNGGNTYNVEINQTGFTVQQKSDANNVARLTESAIRQGLGNGGL